ncbi:MAG: riboflavin biosynthesis protein RibF [Clostridia bacterium]|nr:riboflavin biosynthesis protein RibF [Clostridia bacterium]
MLDKQLEPVVIALGYFDSVHLGHQKVINNAQVLAKNKGAKVVVFTFKGNLKGVLNGEKEKTVFTWQEREKFIKDLGVDDIYFAPTNREFLSLSKKEFLDKLCSAYKVVGFVSGKDYRFGKFGEGGVSYLSEYAKDKGITYLIVDTLSTKSEKISTTLIKSLLSDGKIKEVNALLGRKYSITGEVFADRKVGRAIGYPTLNIKVDKDKHGLKDGVYFGDVTLDGIKYGAVINYGARPTYGLEEKLIEAHVIDFSGDLYGKTVTLFFNAFMREVKKFDSEEQLKEQLKADVKSVRDGNYD